MTVDDEYLMALAREAQGAAYTRDRNHDDRCTACGHSWHGLPCTAPGAAFTCTCPTAFRGGA